MALSIHSIYKRLFKIWRVKRFDLFCRLLSPSREESLLDVGGTPGYWTALPPAVGRIDSLNIHEISFDNAAHPEHYIRTLTGNGCCLEFADQSYDIAYSNSVIEHVGSWEDQKAFATELRRVGGKIWCQTPAQCSPIEPHYLAPFIHWLPYTLQRKLIRHFTLLGLIEKPSQAEVDEMVSSIRLLTHREMRQLFPDCTIITEYLLPMIPKSYIAVRTCRTTAAE